MPCYDYKCPACGHEVVEFMKMCSAADAPYVLCPKCVGFSDFPEGGSILGTRRHEAIMERQVSQVHTDLKDFSTPIEMHSIGCTSVEQIREMQRAGVSISDDESDPLYGTPIAHNRHEKLKALKIAGFQETK